MLGRDPATSDAGGRQLSKNSKTRGRQSNDSFKVQTSRVYSAQLANVTVASYLMHSHKGIMNHMIYLLKEK